MPQRTVRSTSSSILQIFVTHAKKVFDTFNSYVFSKYGVSIVLQGHNHVYERLTPINGITYITAGSGGEVDKGNSKPGAMQRVVGNDETEIFLMLEFDEKTCRLTA